MDQHIADEATYKTQEYPLTRLVRRRWGQRPWINPYTEERLVRLCERELLESPPLSIWRAA